MNAFDYFFSHSRSYTRNFVLGSDEEITFSQLYKNSLAIAGFLKAQLGENKEVLLVSSNSVFFIAIYLGVIKSGNICVPINPAIEQSNLDHIIRTTDCKLVFAADGIKQVFHSNSTKVIRESDMHNILSGQNLLTEVLSEDFDCKRTALILFTSGSTNTPKGVMLSHLNISSNSDSIIDYLQLTKNDIVGVVLPFYYCYGLSLIHTHLRVGGSIVLINDFIFLGSVIHKLKKFRCTGFAGVPSHFQILLRKSTTFSTTEFPDLRYVTQAGGKLHDVFIEEFKKAFASTAFYVMYGQTEATARLAYLPPEMLTRKLGSIGKAIPGVILEIHNELGEVVDRGEIGEIVAQGNNIMKGYYKDSAATTEALKDGWLLTGDLAKMDKDGFIYLIGRKKEIIKVGGRRVSPKEIEEVILTIQEIIDCTVEGVSDEILGEGIQATVVIKEGSDAPKIKEKILLVCREKLSLFKIPRTIEFEKSLNVNTAGKKVKSLVNS